MAETYWVAEWRYAKIYKVEGTLAPLKGQQQLVLELVLDKPACWESHYKLTHIMPSTWEYSSCVWYHTEAEAIEGLRAKLELYLRTAENVVSNLRTKLDGGPQLWLDG